MTVIKDSSSNLIEGLCKLEIDNELTIYVIDSIKNQISDEMEKYTSFEFNLSKVEEIDSAGLQLLLAFKNELLRKDKQFEITSASQAVSDLLTIYGIDESLEAGAATV